MSFWEGWWLAYWPVATVLLATVAEGAAAVAAVIWLQVPWMLLGWPVKRLSECWTAKMRRQDAWVGLDRVREDAERGVCDESGRS